MSRRPALLALLLATAVANADAPLAIHGDPLPPGAVARFGMPGLHQNEFAYVGGYTPAGSIRVAVAQAKVVRVWAWEPAHARPPVHQLAGHAAEVMLVAMSPDARFLASADKAGEIRLWELATGEGVVLKKPGAAVTALAVGPGGRRVAVAVGRVVTLHDRPDQRTIRIGEHDLSVTALAFAADGTRLATADAKGRTSVWKPDGTPLAELPWEPIVDQAGESGPPGVIDFTEGVRKLVFSPDGKQLAGGGGTVVRVWDIDAGRVLWTHNRHARFFVDGLLELGGAMPRAPAGARQVGRVWDLAFSRDGLYLASSGIHGDVRIVRADRGDDVRPPNPADRFKGRDLRFTGLVGLAFGPDGKSLTMFDGARKFVRETIVGGRPLGNVSGHGTAVTGLAVSADGKWLASADDYGQIRVWRLATGECAAESRTGHGAGRGTAFSPDGRWLVAGGAYHGFGVLRRGGDAPTFAEPEGPGVGRWRVHAFLPGHDARLYVASDYTSSRGIDLADRKEHGPGFALRDEPKHLAVSPDGKWVAVTFGYAPSRGPRVFSIATGKEGSKLEGIESLFAAVVAFSPDSRLLAAGSEAGVTLWEVATGKKYLHPGKHDRPTEVLAFSPDGRVLASGGDRDLKLWEVATGRLLAARRADGRAVTALTFLPQPGRLASAGTDGEVLIWDVSKELRQAAPVPKDLGRGVTAPAETGYWTKRISFERAPSALAFSPDGKTLAVGLTTGTVRLVDFASEKQTAALDGHTSDVLAVQYSPDGKTVLGTAVLFDGNDRRAVRAWDPVTGKVRWAAKTRQYPSHIGFSPDGKAVYSLGVGSVPRWDVGTGEPLEPVRAYDRYMTALAISPDGKHLMVGGFQGEVVLWDLTRDQKVRDWWATESNQGDSVRAVAFSPKGETAMTAADNGRVRTWDVATGKMRVEWAVEAGTRTAAYAPTGDLLALASDPAATAAGRVTIWDPKTGTERLRLAVPGPHLAWSPDGRWLATADVRHAEKEHYVLVWDIGRLLNR